MSPKAEKHHPAHKPMGRPKVYGQQVDFEMRKWSKDIIDKIDEHVSPNGPYPSRRAYIEHLLRTHPELQEDNAA